LFYIRDLGFKVFNVFDIKKADLEALKNGRYENYVFADSNTDMHSMMSSPSMRYRLSFGDQLFVSTEGENDQTELRICDKCKGVLLKGKCLQCDGDVINVIVK
jgi:hypothetical protein